MNAEGYTKLIEEALAEDEKRDRDIQHLVNGLYNLTVAFEALLDVVSTMNKTDKSLMDTLSVLQRSVRELQEQTPVPDPY